MFESTRRTWRCVFLPARSGGRKPHGRAAAPGPRRETLRESAFPIPQRHGRVVRDEEPIRRELTFETVMWRSMRRQVAAVFPGEERAERLMEEVEAAGGGAELEERRLRHGRYSKVTARP